LGQEDKSDSIERIENTIFAGYDVPICSTSHILETPDSCFKVLEDVSYYLSGKTKELRGLAYDLTKITPLEYVQALAAFYQATHLKQREEIFSMLVKSLVELFNNPSANLEEVTWSCVGTKFLPTDCFFILIFSVLGVLSSQFVARQCY
jgi:hypothetical protein